MHKSDGLNGRNEGRGNSRRSRPTRVQPPSSLRDSTMNIFQYFLPTRIENEKKTKKKKKKKKTKKEAATKEKRERQPPLSECSIA